MRYLSKSSASLAAGRAGDGSSQRRSARPQPYSAQKSALTVLAVVVASVPAGALAAAIIKRANMYLVGAGLLGLGTVTGTACGASLPFTPVVAGAACAISLAASLAGSLYAVIAGATGNSVVSDMRIHQHITQPCADGQKLLHCLAGQHRGEPLHFANHTVDGGVFDLFYHKDGNRHVLSTKEQDKEGAHDKRREGVESDVNGSDVYMGIAFDDDNAGDERAISQSHTGLKHSLAHYMDSQSHAQQFRECVSFHDQDDNSNVAFRGEIIMANHPVFNQPGQSLSEANSCNGMNI